MSIEKNRLWSIIISILVIMVLVTGCGTKEDSTASLAPNSIASSSPEAPENESKSEDKKVYTDMAGREVKLPTDIKKIISLRHMEIFMLSSILGDELDDKVISLGLSLKENNNDGYKKLSESLNMDNMINIGSVWEDDIDVEKVVGLEPDIIIVDTQFKNKACVKKMIEVNLPVVFTDISTDPIYGELDSIEMLGKMLGKEERVNKLVSYAKGKTEQLFKRIDEINTNSSKQPTIYFEQGNVTPKEIGCSQGDSGGSWGYLMDKMGTKNIGGGLGYVNLDPEKILSSDPDIIIVGGSNWDPTSNIMRMGYYQTAEAASKHLGEYVSGRAGWDQLSAVKNKRLYSIFFNAEVNPYSFAVYEAMAKYIYPKELADLDPQADLEEFFKLYMPYPYSGTFFAQWDGK